MSPQHSPMAQNFLPHSQIGSQETVPRPSSLPTQSVGYPNLRISCPLLITLNLCNLNTRPRLGRNDSQSQLLSVLSMMCSLKILQDLRLH